MTEEYFNHIVIAWILLGIVVFMVNLKIVAPYGRHVSAKWGFLVNSRLAWVVMESPVLLMVIYFVYLNSIRIGYVEWLLIFLFCAHYFHRIFIYPLRIHVGGGKVPLGIMLLAIIFNMMNGYLIGYYLTKFATYNLSWFYSMPFIIGGLLFAAGAFINWRADSMLINLRKGGFKGYKVPRGFLFGKISCPNHFGEMIEWTGYALMSFSLPALAFSVWTFANLIPRAIAHHKWYKEKFSDYPSERKAFLPGIW